MNYFCYRCGYETTRKCDMRSHLTRKNMCKPKLRNIDIKRYSDMILNKKKYNFDEEENDDVEEEEKREGEFESQCEEDINNGKYTSPILIYLYRYLSERKKFIDELKEQMDENQEVIDKAMECMAIIMELIQLKNVQKKILECA